MQGPRAVRPGIIVLVTGGRDYDNKRLVFRALDELHRRNVIKRVVHGGARGADALAGRWAKRRGVPCDVFPVSTAEWMAYGLAAGPRGNRIMLRKGKPDVVLAFPGNAGTEGMVELAQKARVLVLDSEVLT